MVSQSVGRSVSGHKESNQRGWRFRLLTTAFEVEYHRLNSTRTTPSSFASEEAVVLLGSLVFSRGPTSGLLVPLMFANSSTNVCRIVNKIRYTDERFAPSL